MAETKKPKNKHSVHFTSESQTWNTPRLFYNPLNDLWQFTLDAAALESSALCPKFYTPETNSLVQSWAGETVWCNPPYNDIKSWTKKCAEEFSTGNSTIMMLIPSRTDTLAFHDSVFYNATVVCFIKGRLKFADPTLRPDEKVNPAPFPSCLVVYDNNLTNEKLEYLKSLGAVVKMA